MQNLNWTSEFDAAITVCDEKAIIISMNDKACKTFEKYGGKNLIGKSLYDCHNEKSQQAINELLSSGKKNIYSIEKNGIKKLIHQSPWYKEGKIAGLVELSIEIPFEMEHF